MGRTTRWFKSLIGSSKPDHPSPPKQNNNNNNSNNNNNNNNNQKKKKKSKWGFNNNNNNNRRYSYNNKNNEEEEEEDHVAVVGDANRHAIAVAEATAVVAEAALAAAQAAAEVVRLTTGGGMSRPGTGRRRRDWAAVIIQSSFRAYLARRALRALKGLVRLQALVRGHIVRRQSADMLRRMQSLARIQARVCANRAHISESSQSSTKSSKTRNAGIATPRKHDKKLRVYSLKSDRSPTQKNGQTKIKNKGSIDLETALKGSNWLNRWMEECSWNNQGNQSLTYVRPDDERSDKILEVDTCYPHLNLNLTEKLRTSSHHALSYGYGDHGVTLSESLSRHSTKSRKKNPSVSSCESSVKYPTQIDEAAVWTTENSPQVLSRPGSSGGRKGPFTPAKSECSRSFFNGYHGYPNYMSNTESYRAKVRSQSAPRQRIPLSTTRFYNGYGDSETISENGSALHDNFKVKAYPSSGRSDRPLIPVRGNYNSTYTDRH